MERNVKVTIHTDHIVQDKKEIQKILDRVSKIISSSYVRQMKGVNG